MADGTDIVQVDRDGAVVTITLHRPERLNALGNAMADGMQRALDGLGDARAVVLTGAGGAFSSGWDLKDASDDRSTGADWTELNERLAALDIPTVAAIEGWCLGGGLALAVACDFRVAARDARLGMPEVRRGIFPGMSCAWRIPRLIGVARALDLLVIGDHVDGTTAHGWGLVHRLSEPGRAYDDAVVLAGRLAAGAPLAQRAITTMVWQAFELDREEARRLEAEVAAPVGTSKDVQEGIAAFVERREPRFQGR
ncbi:MAG TPA: enoyl-CoA hydratase/isomerase family protein [Nitriliruptorales bacterium]